MSCSSQKSVQLSLDSFPRQLAVQKPLAKILFASYEKTREEDFTNKKEATFGEISTRLTRRQALAKLMVLRLLLLLLRLLLLLLLLKPTKFLYGAKVADLNGPGHRIG
jgi:hypothetical protein